MAPPVTDSDALGEELSNDPTRPAPMAARSLSRSARRGAHEEKIRWHLRTR
jgi:hypothetical protein